MNQNFLVVDRVGTRNVAVLPFNLALDDGTFFNFPDEVQVALSANQTRLIAVRKSDKAVVALDPATTTFSDPTAGDHILIARVYTNAEYTRTIQPLVNQGMLIHKRNVLNHTKIDSATVTAYSTKGEEIVHVDPTTAAVTVTLPTAEMVPGRRISIADIGNAALTNNITIATEGAEQINGAATAAIATNRGHLTLESDGSSWLAY